MAKKKEGGPKEVATVEVDQERINKVVRKGLLGGKTVREMADKAGVKPEEILRRKAELLDGADVLTIQEKRILLTVELSDLARAAREKAETISDERNFSGAINSSVSAIKTYLGELARMEKSDTGKIEALNDLRRKELLRLVDAVVRKTISAVSIKYEVPEESMMRIFQENLIETAREVDEQ